MSALRELLLAVKVKVDRSGIDSVNKATQEATKSASGLERMLRKVASASKALGERKAKAEDAFAQSLGFGTKARPRAPRKDALKIDNTDLLASLTEKPKTGLEALKEKFNSTFAGAGAHIREVTATIDRLAAKLFSARMAMAGFAAVIVGRAISDFIGSVVGAGGALSEMSQRTRVSVESLYAWGQLAADNSIDASVLESSFRKLSKSMRASEKGGSAQAKAFAELGVSAKNASGTGLRPVEDVLIDVGVALNQMEDDAKATALAQQLLGPAGYGLVPAFEAGGDAVRKYLKTAKELAPLSKLEAAQLDEIGDATERGSKRWKALKDRLVVGMIPALDLLSRKFEQFSTWLFVTVKQSKLLETMLGMLAAGGIARLVVLFGSWVAKVGGARAAITLLSQGLRTATGAALRFLAPLLLIEDFLTFLAGGKSLFGRAVNEIFGDGGAKEARKDFLNWGAKARDILGEVGNALGAVAGSELFKGPVKAALDAILGVLNAIGLALSSNTEKANALAEALDRRKKKFTKDATGFQQGNELPTKERGSESGPTAETWVEKVPGFKWLRNKVQSDPTVAADYAKNNAATMSVVPPATLTGSAANVSRNVTYTDKRTVEVNVTSTTNPGAVGRAVAQSVSTEMSQDPRQVLQSVSE